eukprot:EG_transcript_19837
MPEPPPPDGPEGTDRRGSFRRLAGLQAAVDDLDLRAVEAVALASKTTVRRELYALPRTARPAGGGPLTAAEWVPALGPLLDWEDPTEGKSGIFLNLYEFSTRKNWRTKSPQEKHAWLRTAAETFQRHQRPLTVAALGAQCAVWVPADGPADSDDAFGRPTDATASAEQFVAAFQAATTETWLFPWSDRPYQHGDDRELVFAVVGPLRSEPDQVVVAAFHFNCYV